MTACGTKRTCQPRRSASALRTKRTSASDSKRLECDGKPHGTSAHAVRSLSEVGFVPGVCHEKLVGLLCDGALILAIAAIPAPADAKTSKGKPQYLQIKLQGATSPSVRTKPASPATSTAKTGGATRSR